MDEHRHVALPKLFGAPAYARPPTVAANPMPRPIDPDDLPLVAEMAAEDVEHLEAPAILETPDDVEHLDDPAILEVLATAEDPATPEIAAAPPTETAELGGSSDEAIATAPPADATLPRPFSIRELADRIRGSRP